MARKKKNPSLESQVNEKLKSMLCIGRSRHEDKKNGISTQDKIYAWESYHGYLRQCKAFARWCKERGCKTIEDMKSQLVTYLQEGERSGKFSASTIATKAAAAMKLFQCEREDVGIFKDPEKGYVLPSRNRAGITRTRTLSKQWNPVKHPEISEFLSSTGLRRHEAAQLRGTDLKEEDGQLFVHVRQGKGGKPRYVPVMGSPELVRSMMEAAGEEYVFPQGISKNCPIHYFRAIYADRIYDLHARDLETCKRTPFWNRQHWNKATGKHEAAYDRDSVYWCRGDRKGEWLDKEAMLLVAKALGHNRISVAGAHYIHNLKGVEEHGESEDDN